METMLHLTKILRILSISPLPIQDAIPSADQVRITPSLRSQKGSVWTKNKVNFNSWEAEVTFRVSGRGRMGADGLVRSGDVSEPSAQH